MGTFSKAIIVIIVITATLLLKVT